MTSRRRPRRPADLTALVDVLFILVFAALIRTAAVQQAEAEAPPPPSPTAPVTPPPPAGLAALRARALANLDAQLAARTPLVIHLSATGTLEALEAAGTRIALDIPLLEHSPDPDIGLTYLGERSAELRVCRIAAVHLRVDELAGYLVIIAPARPLADLPHALHQGLHRDLERCLREQRGLATIVDPSVTTP